MGEDKTRRGFDVPCIRCGEPGGVRVTLRDVACFDCAGCDAGFTADEVREGIRRWRVVLAWLAVAPAYQEKGD